MATMQTEFEQLEQECDSGGVAAVLDQLAQQLRAAKKYHELFEALKMRIRDDLGLPLLYHDNGDDLDEQHRNKLEERLLEACREVGLLLLRDGQIREGWLYLRPVGDRALVANELAQIEADEDNIDALVEVLLHEGVDPARGYALVLANYGTCNAITTYESSLGRRSKSDQQAAAELLVEHLHHELLATVRADIAQQEGREPGGSTLRELVADRDWLFGEHSYHIDTTHLASTVRFSRILEHESHLRLALDLTEYGRRLSSQFQYQGEEPFADIYPSHALFLGALLGENEEEALDFFRRKTASLDPAEHGSQPIEAYLQLLDRLGRYVEAIEALIQFASSQQNQSANVMPLLLELSEKAGDYSALMEFCRERHDLLGFASGLLRATYKQG